VQSLSDLAMTDTIQKPHLQVVVASTRPGRKGALVGAWALEQALAHGGFTVELVDLAEVALPMFDEPNHPILGRYEHAHTRAWSELASKADAYVFVTPEYDHAPPAALLNALQYLVKEWAYKPVGFVSYGAVAGGTRAVQLLKPVVTALRMMPIPEGVVIPFFTKSIDSETGAFDPGEIQERGARAMLDELKRWAEALSSLRAGQPA
jgi:NAD(P)H-dependent FMN reductase